MLAQEAHGEPDEIAEVGVACGLDRALIRCVKSRYLQSLRRRAAFLRGAGARLHLLRECQVPIGIGKLVFAARDRAEHRGKVHGGCGQRLIVSERQPARYLAQQHIAFGFGDQPIVGPQLHQRAVAAQELATKGVQRADRWLGFGGDCARQQGSHTLAHFPGSLVGERERQNAPWLDSPLEDEMGYPAHERGRLAGPWSGDDESRRLGRRRRALPLIQR